MYILSLPLVFVVTLPSIPFLNEAGCVAASAPAVGGHRVNPALLPSLTSSFASLPLCAMPLGCWRQQGLYERGRWGGRGGDRRRWYPEVATPQHTHTHPFIQHPSQLPPITAEWVVRDAAGYLTSEPLHKLPNEDWLCSPYASVFVTAQADAHLGWETSLHVHKCSQTETVTREEIHKLAHWVSAAFACCQPWGLKAIWLFHALPVRKNSQSSG